MNKLKEALANRRLSTFAATNIPNVTVNREKCNHQLASNVIRSRYANCELSNVSYI